MKRIPASYLLRFTTEQLWETLIGEFKLVFDDGVEVTTNYREACISSHYWDMIRAYPNTAFKHSHILTTVLKGKPLDSKSLIKLAQNIYWDVADDNGLFTPLERVDLTRMVHDVNNQCYNDAIIRSEPFAVTIDILDFIEVVEHPRVKEDLEELGNMEFEPTPTDAAYARERIEKSYKDLTDLIYNDQSLNDNNLAKAVRCGMASPNQTLQCVGPRGFMTEVDGVLIPVPVTRSYTAGMRSLTNIISESRSAAKSLYFSEAPLEDAEYFARRMQLLCNTVERLVYTDCGSTDYMIFRPHRKTKDNPQDDLELIAGLYYFDDDEKKLKVIKDSDHHLYDKSLKLRVPHKCNLKDKHAICSTCFGKLSDNLAPGFNLGHMCSATFTRQTSQSVLSIKHYDANSKSATIMLNDSQRKYFKTGQNGSAYVLLESYKSKSLKLVITQREAAGLTDILLVNDVFDLNVSRVSSVDAIGIYPDENAYATEVIQISVGGRNAQISYELLAYIKTNGWLVDDRGNFVISLNNWNITKPMFTVPEKEFSFQQHSSQVAKVIESRVTELHDRQRPGSVDATVVELHDILNSKLKVPLAICSVIMYASSTYDAAGGNFNLSRGSLTPGLGVANLTVAKRSLSGWLASRYQLKTLTSPESFFAENRPDSPMDVFFAPKEVVEAYPFKYRHLK